MVLRQDRREPVEIFEPFGTAEDEILCRRPKEGFGTLGRPLRRDDSRLALEVEGARQRIAGQSKRQGTLPALTPESPGDHVATLRLGKFDALIGINLLREGLDIPEVSLVAILDADKEGYLRSATSLIQTAGRAARNVNGEVIMYADHMTDSLTATVRETERRRELQAAYNVRHGITPESIRSSIRELLHRHHLNN